jgi:mono/diheme cytochrome c family protein
MFDFLGVLLLLLLVFVLGWITRRAWRAKRPVVKWLGTTLTGLLALVASVLLGAALFGYWKLNRTYNNPVPQLSVAVTPEHVARGERFAHLCAGCHAPDTGAAMTGRDFLAESGPPIGDFYAPNLTPVHLAYWSDGEIVRAIREGVHRSGRSLLIMPSSFWRTLSDEDVQAIVAYLRSLPAEGSETPPNRLNVLGAVMSLQAPIFAVQPPITEPVVSPPVGPTAAYGAYVSSFTCEICHGSNLLGDPDSQAPPLVAIPLAWGEQEFIEFMRTGSRPDGSSVDGEAMPWKDLSRLLSGDDDLRAIYAHLQEEGAEYTR